MIRAIDLFAGGGGFTEGAHQTGAVEVVWAANHWPVAVATHAANHPNVQHACQDLQQADWTKVPQHDLLLASPACQGHSRARGADRPHHDAQRSTAWAVLAALEAHLPEAFVVENVVEFGRWGLFPFWRMTLQALGYYITETVLNAQDFGVPQSRERLFVTGSRRRGLTIQSPGLAHVPASTVIDHAADGWSPIDRPGRSARILAQVEAGRAVHGDRFLVAYYGAEKQGRSLDKPLGTVTTTDRFALVDGDRARMLNAGEYRRAMGFPDGYHLPRTHRDSIKVLGNAVPPPMARGIIAQVAAQMGAA